MATTGRGFRFASCFLFAHNPKPHKVAVRSPSQGVPGHNPSPCIKRHRAYRTPVDTYSSRAHQRYLRVLSWADGRHSVRCLFVCPATHPLTYFPLLPVPAKPTKLQILPTIIQTADHSNTSISFCHTKSNILKNIRDLTTRNPTLSPSKLCLPE